MVPPENQAAQAESKSIEEAVIAGEKDIWNDGCGYFNRNF
jgi:hypothetical protein